MEQKIILPKTYVDEIKYPLIFLAGPIKGATQWQDEAINFLFSQNKDLFIANPRRSVDNALIKYVTDGRQDYFPRQRAWERYYLDMASRNGCIIFWLPGEIEHNCNKSYGAMTRLELGEWFTRYSLDNSIRFCVGADGFSELDTIAYDLSLDAPDKIIFKTLEETCLEAIKLAIQT